MSTFLKEGEVQILHPLQCPTATNLHAAYNFKSMLCAFSEQYVDTCQASYSIIKILATLLMFFITFQGDSGGVSLIN